MITHENIHLILAAIAWPLVATSAIFLFRQPIKQLLLRLKEAKFLGKSGTSLAFGETSADRADQALVHQPRSPQDSQGSSARLVTTKPANMFWLGSDLMDLFDALLRGGDRNVIVRGLRQSNHHLKSVGLDGSPLQQRLQRLFEEADKSLDKDWTDQRRIEYAKEIRGIVREFGNIVETSQPGFEGFPKQ